MDGVEEPGLVSVIIPCYGHAHFLAEAIESALGQTYPRKEVLVVDDGSPDDTAAVAGRYRGIRYVRQHNMGLSGARNTGIRESRGAYLVFLDADDRLLPNALQAGVGQLRTHEHCAFVSGHHRCIGVDGRPHRPTQPRLTAGLDGYAEMLKVNYIGMHAAVMYRREIFDVVGAFDTTLRSCEDYDLFLRIMRRYPVHRYDEIVSEYRQHGESMSANAGRMLRTALQVLKRQWPQIQDSVTHMRAMRLGVREVRGRWPRRSIKNGLRFAARGQWPEALRMSVDALDFAGPWMSAVFLDIKLGLLIALGACKRRRVKQIVADAGIQRSVRPDAD